SDRGPVLFMYLGRRGALGRFTLELAQAARYFPEIGFSFVVSRANGVAKDIEALGSSLLKINTFDSTRSLSIATNFFSPRRQLLLCAAGTSAVGRKRGAARGGQLDAACMDSATSGEHSAAWNPLRDCDPRCSPSSWRSHRLSDTMVA